MLAEDERVKPKIKQSPKQPAEKRRHQLLASAKKLFIKKGYRGTTTEEIARAARLTKGALYHHFRSKEDILLALVHDTNCKYDEILVQVCKPGVSPLELLTGFFSIHHREDMADFRNVIDLWVQAMRIPSIKKQMDDFIAEATMAFAENIDVKYGKDLETRRHLATLVLSLYDGLAVRKSMKPSSVDIPAQLKLFEIFQDSLVNVNTGKRKRGGDKRK